LDSQDRDAKALVRMGRGTWKTTLAPIFQILNQARIHSAHGWGLWPIGPVAAGNNEAKDLVTREGQYEKSYLLLISKIRFLDFFNF